MARESWTSGELEKLKLVRFGCVDGVFVVRCVRVGLLLYSISLRSSKLESNCLSTTGSVLLVRLQRELVSHAPTQDIDRQTFDTVVHPEALW